MTVGPYYHLLLVATLLFDPESGFALCCSASVQKSLGLDVAVAHAGHCYLQGAASHFCFPLCAHGGASDNATLNPKPISFKYKSGCELPARPNRRTFWKLVGATTSLCSHFLPPSMALHGASPAPHPLLFTEV